MSDQEIEDDLSSKDPNWDPQESQKRHEKPKPKSEGKQSRTEAADLMEELEDRTDPNKLGMGKTEKIDDMSIRPVTLASLEMLRMVGSPLIKGIEVEDSVELLPYCLEFLYLHCEGEDEAMEYALEEDKKARKKTILKWSSKIEVKDHAKFVEGTLEVLNKSVSTQVEGEFPKYDESNKESMAKPKGNG